MSDKKMTVELVAATTSGSAEYTVTNEDGRTFRLGFARSLLDVWEQQLSRSGSELALDSVAEELAHGILTQDPSAEQLSEGFLVTLDNAFATPLAAEENLRNSGLVAFAAAHRPLHVAT